MLKQKIQQQINDIRDDVMFDAYHKYDGHAIDRHVMNNDELRKALWAKPRPVNIDDIVMVTRFESKAKALEIIAETLQMNIDSIEKWLLSNSEEDLVATATYEEATGDGYAKNTDWSKTIPVHSVRVVIRKNFKLISRSFVIVTAYPTRSFDDVDAIYDAIDDFISRKN